MSRARGPVPSSVRRLYDSAIPDWMRLTHSLPSDGRTFWSAPPPPANSPPIARRAISNRLLTHRAAPPLGVERVIARCAGLLVLRRRYLAALRLALPVSRRPECNGSQQLIIRLGLLLQEHLAQTQPVRQLRGALDHQLLHLRIRNAGKAGIRDQGGRQTTVEVFEKTFAEYVGSDGIRLIPKGELGMTAQGNCLTPIGLEVEKLQG